MDKRYTPTDHEQKIYQLWEKSNAFKPEINPNGEPYCIIMPPPNANEVLHIGHARFIAIEDTLIRYARMQGKSTLWLPGTDHAGIETQYVFEKKLAKKGKSRFDYDRNTLYQMIWEYVQEQGQTATNQMKSLGASADWSRTKFTLDKNIVKIVCKTFQKLHNDGLLYRGLRLINYCTKCGTGYSELEVNHIERQDPLYYIKYGPFTLATVRPETKFGDTALAVHPNDKRYQKYIGQEITAQGLLKKIKLKVIADKHVDPQFGTGVVKITPAHDPNDFEVGQKHHLEIKQIINYNGKLNHHTGKYEGLRIKKARQIIAEDLKKAGLMEKINTKYTHVVGICYRCKTDIEPLPLEQWFIKTQPLANKALKAVKNKQTTFTADKYRKIYNHWLKNLKDWNLSRQIVWGIRIPAWKCQKCNEWTITDGKTPKQCIKCKHKKLKQDPDTFDTWFSSGQWPFATLQALDQNLTKNQKLKTKNYDTFYPTALMETGFDILKFWVSRMVMLGIYKTGKVPFKKILIHGLVRDGQGRKISKSIGNVINPLDWTAKYGTDALRFSLLYGGLIHSDLSLAEDKVRGMRNFANKIWNIGRFIEMNFEQTQALKHSGGDPQDSPGVEGKQSHIPWYSDDLPGLKPEDKTIIKQLNNLIIQTTKHLDKYQLNEAAQLIYDFTWHQLADKYIETIKPRLQPNETKNQKLKTKNSQLATLSVLRHTYINILKLLHPFMPFITETIWQELKHLRKHPNQLLITSKWPQNA